MRRVCNFCTMGALAVLVTGMLASAKSGQLRKGGYVDATTQQPMPAFSGTVTGFTGKTLTVESPESNTILFNCSKKTKYYAAEKRIGHGLALGAEEHTDRRRMK